jgi:hypothetical protein
MRGSLLIVGVLATSQPAWAKYDPCGHIAMLEPAGRVSRNAKIWMWKGGDERLRIRGAGLDRAIAPPLGGTRHGLAALDPGVLGSGERYRIQIVGDGYAWTLGELATEGELDTSRRGLPGSTRSRSRSGSIRTRPARSMAAMASTTSAASASRPATSRPRSICPMTPWRSTLPSMTRTMTSSCLPTTRACSGEAAVDRGAGFASARISA